MGREGSGVTAASSTTIAVSFVYRGERCRERLKLEPTPANLVRAEKFRGDILASIANDDFDYEVSFPHSKNRHKFAPEKARSLGTFDEFMRAYLASQEKVQQSSSYRDIRKIIQNVLPKSPMVNLAIEDLTAVHLDDYCNAYPAGNKRIGNIVSPIRCALDRAVMLKKLRANPLYGWTFERRKEEVKEDDDDVDVFTAEEQRLVLAELKPKNRWYMQFAFWSGLRTSEQIGLEWRDINFERGTIRVVRKITIKSVGAEIPKTKGSKRTIKLLKPAREALIEYQKIFGASDGKIFHVNGDEAVREIWLLACTKAGVRYRYPYQTRHTYASMMLTAGEEPMWLARQMGHKDWGMIRKIYGHLIEGALTDAGSKAELMFARKDNI